MDDNDLGFLGQPESLDGGFMMDDTLDEEAPPARPSLQQLQPTAPPCTIRETVVPPASPQNWSGQLYATVKEATWIVPVKNGDCQFEVRPGTRLLVLNPPTTVEGNKFMQTVVAHPVQGEPVHCLVLAEADGKPLLHQYSVTEVYLPWVESCFSMGKAQTSGGNETVRPTIGKEQTVAEGTMRNETPGGSNSRRRRNRRRPSAT